MYMPFGLRNIPSTFQRLMDLVLSELLHCARAYIDYVVIFSATWDDHKQYLKAVLGGIREVGLMAKPTKCAWANATCSYLRPCHWQRNGLTGTLQSISHTGFPETHH